MSTGNTRPKILLILEHSEDPSVQVGLVKDCHNSMPIDMSTCDVVGTWGRFGEGTLYVELTTTVEALQDVFIQLIAELEEGTQVRMALASAAAPGLPRGPISAPSAQTKDFSNLRAKLGR